MADERILQGGPTEENRRQIVPVLQGYLQEAQQARRGGLNPRDDKWEENCDLYWNRFDHSRKAAWQARESMPEVSGFVDRFAAALKEALITGPTGFYSVEDPADVEGDVTDCIKRMTDCWLSTSGRNQTGTCLDFAAVFEEQVKLGALMACSSMVTWKNDTPGGRVAIETIDPRKVWLDHTYDNLYRVRRQELDKHKLKEMALLKDGKGKPIYNLDAIDEMCSHIALEAQNEAERLTGTGAFSGVSNRTRVTIDEYLATVISPTGEVLAKDALMVVGNENFLIRGPEPNPFWHGKDWMVFCPLVTTPLSVYGRSYMEDFGQLAKTFNNLTNLILDAVQVSALNLYAVVPSMLTNPEQLTDGIYPNKTFWLEDGSDAKAFMQSIEMGNLPAEAVTVWTQIKNELTEAADQNEIGLGQLAPKGRTSATEITQTQESASALVRSIAQTVESRYLQPTLDLVWQTGLQHAKPNDSVLMAAAGPEMYKALLSRRKELIKRPITFQARGISTLIQKQRMVRSLMQLTQYLAQSPELLAAFMQKVDMEKFIKMLFHLSDIDLSKLAKSEREQLMAQVAQPMQQAAGQAGPPPQAGAAPEMADQAVQALGVGK